MISIWVYKNEPNLPRIPGAPRLDFILSLCWDLEVALWLLCTVCGYCAREWGAHRNQDHNWYLSMMLYGVELPMIVRHQMREMMKSLGGLDLARKWKSSLGTEMTAQLRNKNPTRRIIHPCGVVRCWWIYTKRSKDYCSKLMRHSSLSAMFLVLFFPFEVETFSSATEICTAGGRYIFF